MCLFLELSEFGEALLYLLHLLGMAATLPEANGEGRGEGEQGEAYDEHDAIGGEAVACGGVEAELGDVESDEGRSDNPEWCDDQGDERTYARRKL